MRFAIQLPHEPGSIPKARRELERLSESVDDLTLRNIRLLTSELVTNAIRHVAAAEGDEIELVIERAEGHVRVDVTDRGPGFTPTPRPDLSRASSGWGLHIMSKIADRWGVESDDGSRVWFEIDLAATPQAVGA